MRRLFAILAFCLSWLAAGSTFAATPLTDRNPSATRTVPVNSTTAVAVINRSNVFASAAAGASTSDPNTFTLNTSTTANLYAGLIVKFAGSGSCASASGNVALIKSHTATVATLDTPTGVAVDPNCTYTIGPTNTRSCRILVVGSCAGTCYLSTVSGGTAGTNRVPLTAGQVLTLDGSGVEYLEVLSVNATDNIAVGCFP
jgi:hypothetical protein